ncbi:MAG TPA: aminoacyl-tRNA hydrolase [Candidatus Binataceae bacterium]|nr:aminoacyl-tRNA hydrolase [Candidatus Binataceae bacterium]
MSPIRGLFKSFRKKSDSGGEDDAPRSEGMWVVAGLGNPGGDYSRSRHNAGHMAIDRIAASKGIDLNRKRFKGATGEVRFDDTPVMLVKPETYYNLSGECVSAILGYFKVPLERLIVVHDEVDLPEGRLQVRKGGGDAGNKGVRSVAASLGTPDFIRVRIGTGREGRRDEGLDFLLRPLSKAEAQLLEDSIARAAEAVETIVREDLTRAMNKFNQRNDR